MTEWLCGKPQVGSGDSRKESVGVVLNPMAGTASVAVANVRMSSIDVAHWPSEIKDER